MRNLPLLALSTLYEQFVKDYPQIVAESPTDLKASCDSKIGLWKDHKNSVGFLAGYSCPAATAFCITMCYTLFGQAAMDSSDRAKARNTWVLLMHLIDGNIEGLVEQFKRLIQFSVDQHERKIVNLKKARQRSTFSVWSHNSRRGVFSDRDETLLRRMVKQGPLWRWHWSGDVISEDHAVAIVEASCAFPDVEMAIYTRSFHLLDLLSARPDNLIVWLSGDPANLDQLREAHKAHPWARLATIKDPDDITDSDFVCPEHTGKFELKSACAKCRICYRDTKIENLIFKNSKKVVQTYKRPVSDDLAAEFHSIHHIGE